MPLPGSKRRGGQHATLLHDDAGLNNGHQTDKATRSSIQGQGRCVKMPTGQMVLVSWIMGCSQTPRWDERTAGKHCSISNKRRRLHVASAVRRW